MTRKTLVTPFLASIAIAGACSSGTSGEPKSTAGSGGEDSSQSSAATSMNVCTPGAQIACACPGSMQTGVQICNAQGTGLGACDGCIGASSANSASSSAATTSASSSTGTGGSAPNCPGLEPGSACTVLPQCGCGAGKMCVPSDASGGGDCVPTGAGSKGDSCQKNADCAPGLGCADLFGNANVHVCGELSAQQCSAFSTTLRVDGTSTDVPGLFVCLTQPCDEAHPQNPGPGYDACGPGTTCLYASIGQIQTTICVYPPGAIPIGGPCNNDRDCVATGVCLFQNNIGTCRKACTSNADCPGKTCVSPFPFGWCG